MKSTISNNVRGKLQIPIVRMQTRLGQSALILDVNQNDIHDSFHRDYYGGIPHWGTKRTYFEPALPAKLAEQLEQGSGTYTREQLNDTYFEVLVVSKNDTRKQQRKSIDSVVDRVSPFDKSSWELAVDDKGLRWLTIFEDS
jgi:hypothetical protein